MNKKNLTIAASMFVGVLAVGTFWQFSKHTTSTGRGGSDDALLALIKNDQASFETWVKNGGDLFATLPVIDGKTMTVAEGLAYFERTDFMKYLQENKITFVKQSKDGKDDIVLLSLKKNNPELFTLVMKENPDLSVKYGEKGWTLLHFAAAGCNHKLAGLLSTLKYDTKAKDGSIPLNLAAANDCLPMLSYWKEHNADFKTKDGRGTTALTILKTKKDAAMVAFAMSFEPRTGSTGGRGPASEPELNFYKKRVVPADQKIDYSALIEPEDRPLDATETAEHSEFAD
ncbi:MAG: hypothetical protein ACJ76H_09820 [Bacteriovoracaceae bacterium]